MRRALSRTLGCACALVAAAAIAIAPEGAAAATGQGIHVQRLNTFEAQRMARGGADHVRAIFQWREVQPVKDGPYRWERYDNLMLHASLHGLQVLPTIVGSPEYAANKPARQPRGADDLERFERFLDALVRRYGHDGSFWRTLPLVPYFPVTHWQVWNEPNLHNYWSGPLKPRSYARFLARSRRAIVGADARAQIVLAGMPETKEGLPMSKYLAGLYRVRGFRRLVDVVAANSYATTPRGALATARTQRRVMDRGGDRRKPLWITELGWASAGPKGHPLVKGPGSQARLLTRSFALLERNAARLRLGPIFWYDWRDDGPLEDGELDHFSRHTGLFTNDREPKPAWLAFVDAAGGVPGSGQIPPGTADLGLGNLGNLP